MTKEGRGRRVGESSSPRVAQKGTLTLHFVTSLEHEAITVGRHQTFRPGSGDFRDFLPMLGEEEQIWVVVCGWSVLRADT